VAEMGHNFPQQLQPFAFKVRRDRAQPSDVAAWPRQVRHDAGADGIADRGHDYRHRRCRLLGRERCRRAGGHDYIHVGGDEFGNEGRKPLVPSFRPAKHDLDVTALLVAALAQTLAERSDEIGLQISRGVAQEADPRNLPPTLGARRERPCGHRAAEKRDEFPPPHVGFPSCTDSIWAEAITFRSLAKDAKGSNDQAQQVRLPRIRRAAAPPTVTRSQAPDRGSR